MPPLALLSDIHGNLPALQQVVLDLQRRGVTRVFNLGDHLSGPLWPKETARFLMSQNWVHIQGNHDRQLATHAPQTHGPSDRYAYQKIDESELSWIRSLPPSLELDGEFLLFHGSPAHDTTYLLETVEHGRTRLATPTEIEDRLGVAGSGGVHPPVLLCGHTHLPRVVPLPGGTLVINPGSVGLPAYDDVHPEYHVVETGSPHARYALLEKSCQPDLSGLANPKGLESVHKEADQESHRAWQVELVALPYDHPSAAERARRNGRPDWEIALRTGFMQAL
jgi:predicted phosphodiesterase